MQHVEAGSIARGYAEILCADGPLALLRIHAGKEASEAVEDHLYYAITEGDKVIYVREESDLASDQFNKLAKQRGVEQSGDASAEHTRQDFLATHPTSLPTIRGNAYHKLATQVSELAQRDSASPPEPDRT